ncbi:MAG: glycosyltransferase family 4 protein [Acidimicrobiales bacterium]
MRILLLPSAYHPAVGGVEQLTSRLAAHLVRGGHEVAVWTNHHPADLPAVEVVGGVEVRRYLFPLPRRDRRALAAWPGAAERSFAQLSRDLEQWRPEVLHVQCVSAQGVYAAALARRHRVPLVVSLQGETVMDDHDIYQRSVAMRAALRTTLAAAQVVTGCSAFVLADAVDHFGLRPSKGRVVYNGVDLDEASPGRADPVRADPGRVEAGRADPVQFDPPWERFVLAVGRLVPKKGFDLLIEAFSQLDGHLDVGLVIGGSGEDEARLRDLVEARGLGSRVLLAGRLDRRQVAAAMAAAEVFVLPSRLEPFGIVVLEAMAVGTPVIVSSRGGAGEIVRSGRTGLVVDPFDTPALTAAMAGLLDDQAWRRRLVTAGRERVRRFAWPEIVAQYEAIYRQVGRDRQDPAGLAHHNH